MKRINTNDWITTTNAARIIGNTAQSVLSHVRHHELETLNLGRYIWVKRKDLAAGEYSTFRSKLVTRRKPDYVNWTDIISFAGAAEMRGVSREAIADLARRGRLPIIEIDGVRLTTKTGQRAVLTAEEGGRGNKAERFV